MTKVYLSIPIKYRNFAEVIEKDLGTRGITVLNPCKIVHDYYSKEKIPSYVAKQCWKMIKASDAVILYTDYYGRDCAAEVGYATALDKPVFPFYFCEIFPFLQEDWMIKSSLEPISEGLDSLVERIFSILTHNRDADIEGNLEHIDQNEIEDPLPI